MANKIQLRRGLKSQLPSLSSGEPAYTTDTRELFIGTGAGNVNMGGSQWYTGTAISGTSTTTGAYSYSACPLVKVGDCYLNTSYGYVYQCTTAGSGTSAKWTYKGSIRGATGSYASVDSALSSTSTNPVQNKAVNGAIDSVNSKIDTFLNCTDYVCISEISDAIDSKLDANFNSNGYIGIDEVTEAIDCKLDGNFNSNGYIGIDEVTEALDDRLIHTTITTATDINTLKTTGIYHIASHNCDHRPPSNNRGTLFVDFTTGTPYQIYIDDGANRTIYKRSYSNVSWSAWDALTSNIKVNPKATNGDIIDTHLTVGKSSGSCGNGSLAVGFNNQSSGSYATSIGYNNFAEGVYSIAMGISNEAAGEAAIALGWYNKALMYQAKVGRSAKEGNAGLPSGTNGDVFTIGIGEMTIPKNGFRVDYSGKCFAYNTMSSTGADYAEVWEWADGNPNNEDRVGRFVAFEGTKIRLATENDPREILGIISAMPAIAGDNFADEWQGMYLKDKFGRLLTEHKSYEAEYEDITVTDEETGEETTESRLVHPAYEADEFIVNPEYDPEQEYIPRMERPEFDAVGTHGKLVVIDDGTCEVGGFCMSGKNGVATASESGFYVMERIDENTIKVYVR